MSSYEQYHKAIDKNTIALLTTHYAGLNVSCIEKLKKLCSLKKIYFIEDAAQALNSYHNNNTGID